VHVKYSHRTVAGLVAVAVLAAGGAAISAGPASAAGKAEAAPLFVHADALYCGYYNGSAVTAPGSTTAAVPEVQCLLIHWGYYSGAIDGIFGPVLTVAVRRFQSDHGLPATGIVDSATWSALRNG
jgi:peptidoglycan hydrolase-like protein with peptidoglycan-binding domain